MDFLGIADEEFIRQDVPMTKQEIRILSLVKAQIAPDAVVYDIGAGTGSISIEAARLAPQGQVYAIERSSEGIGLIRANAANFAVKNVTVIQAEAPEGLADLPEADAILIGGSGGNLQEILTEVTPKLKASGRLVLNCITVQTLMQCIEFMREHSDTYIYEAIQVQVTRLQQVGTYDMAKANNPIYIVTCWKK
ncbi:precorrin-6Y C5,15-methyltransferase (decarboxylating) subunit CbiT [Selenomonas ruminantium]|jgi:cobalt-precorrin-6B (C15)-methyltransferase|uniref:Cobalt-precorrin 7 C15-methyltransferase n=1 Tax=Selenomonas ruminantium TaxID=971 RepID=A0A1K1QFU1_SELRU|nr:precorrin-6Y C5,15-methyltransferase (decarboxylating) subunit CbiT [Selenomonas ruminantium]SEA19881.1 cobalt-precorrin-6B (C15)-methyltransferase [Selenomonas ruminantium]SFB08383.1 cobalt-precorrin 7 C15-methyltransferase [Selenomonas ruminantium]SFW58070.1 cobalt-precorrin-6B (C15)-methyltransferase [Selenomonas ruminantium]